VARADLSEAGESGGQDERFGDVEAFKQAMGTFATGVTVITSLDAGRPVGFTCQSVVSLSLEPPLVALSPAKSSTSWPHMAEAGHFCVNVLSESQVEVGRRFAVSGGDKFPGIAWHKELTGAPVLDGVLAWVDCHLELVHDAGDHEIVIGRVRGVGLGPEGGLPLLYYRGEYRRMDPGSR
jgi:3-hydroxy-9,10-secoandrosta-1,3,5(10)-triene-9,17-dione monooxygenase reductase component